MCLYASGRPHKEIGGSAFDCGILIPVSKSEQPKVFQIIGTNRPLTVFLPDDTPDFSKVGPLPATTAGADPALLATPAGGTASIVGGAIAAGIVAGILADEQGSFVEFRTQPAKGWLRQQPSSLPPESSALPSP